MLTDDLGAAQVETPETLEILGAAAIQGRIPFGPHTGAFDPRPGRGTTDHQPPRTPQPLCASMDGFSLHAQVRIGDGHRERLEKLLRYATRPPICHSRIARAQNGIVLHSLKKTWRDGSTHVVLEPFTLLARLAALIPRPNKKLVTYTGSSPPQPATASGLCHLLQNRNHSSLQRPLHCQIRDHRRQLSGTASPVHLLSTPHRPSPRGHDRASRRRNGPSFLHAHAVPDDLQ